VVVVPVVPARISVAINPQICGVFALGESFGDFALSCSMIIWEIRKRHQCSRVKINSRVQ
jgi:hypothetical protein